MPLTVEDIAKLLVNGAVNWKAEDWEHLGLIRVRTSGPLALLNYRNEATRRNVWTDLERVCRGLIINWQTGEIVARPFDKFFDWRGRPDAYTDAPADTFWEKMDGSLGILYREPDYSGWRIATRGGFDNAQALWATDWLNAHVAIRSLDRYIFTSWTLLFEIIYPENQIVIDYGLRAELVLLAVRDRFTGKYLPTENLRALARNLGVNLPDHRVYPPEMAMSGDVLAYVVDQGEMALTEGGVAVFADGQRFKFKTSHYRQMSRLVWSLTWKNVFEAVRDGRLEDYDGLPPRARACVTAWQREMEALYEELYQRALVVLATMPSGLDRKQSAAYIQRHDRALADICYALRDQHDPAPRLWQQVYAQLHKGYKGVTCL